MHLPTTHRHWSSGQGEWKDKGKGEEKGKLPAGSSGGKADAVELTQEAIKKGHSEFRSGQDRVALRRMSGEGGRRSWWHWLLYMEVPSVWRKTLS